MRVLSFCSQKLIARGDFRMLIQFRMFLDETNSLELKIVFLLVHRLVSASPSRFLPAAVQNFLFEAVESNNEEHCGHGLTYCLFSENKH